MTEIEEEVPKVIDVENPPESEKIVNFADEIIIDD